MDHLIFIICKQDVTEQLADALGDYLHEDIDIKVMEHGFTDKTRDGYISIVCTGAIPFRFQHKVLNDPDVLDFTIYGTSLAEMLRART